MNVRIYSKALAELLIKTDNPERVLSHFLNYLTVKGKQRLYGRVLRSARTIVQNDTTRSALSISIARESDLSQYKGEIEKSPLYTTTTPIVHIDKHIIGGFVLTANGKMIDRSYRRSLLNLYRSITD